MTDQEFNQTKELIAEMSPEAKDKFILERLSGNGESKGNGEEDDGTMTRAEFDALDPMKRHAFMQDGGKIFDPEPEKPERPDLPEGQMYRNEFDALSPTERHAFMQGGGKITN